MDMGTPAAAAVGVAGRRSPRVHPAWLVAAVTFLVLLASAAFRSSLGVLLVPIEDDLGWTRTQTSFAVSLNLVVYGLAAPFAAALLERVGVRRTAIGALLLIAAGCLMTTVMTAPWQLSALWGVVIGAATGSVALGFGAISPTAGSSRGADWSSAFLARPGRPGSWRSSRCWPRSSTRAGGARRRSRSRWSAPRCCRSRRPCCATAPRTLACCPTAGRWRMQPP
jgi:Major Facilitator Superfamily